MKIAQLIFLIPFLFFHSCRKDDKIYEHVPALPDSYTGENSYEFTEIEGGGWSLYSPTILEHNYHSVMIDNWPAGLHNVPLEVNRRDLTVHDFVDTVETYYMGGAYTFSYIYRLNAKGEYKVNNSTIIMDYVLERINDNSSVFTPVEEGYISISRDN